MILVKNLRLGIEESEALLPSLAARALRIDEKRIQSFKIVKKSLDARKKSDIHWLYSVAVDAGGAEDKTLRRSRNKNAEVYKEKKYKIARCTGEERPVIVGFGPAGIFAGLVLAEAGARPIILERGCAADERRAKVEHFWETGELDENSNVQFGEGGAGMFSDGKLNTGTHDERIAWVLKQFHVHGAHESVCCDSKPHVGTDVLIDVVKSMRARIIALGGELRCCSKMTGIVSENGAVSALEVEAENGTYVLPCRHVILAIGHSARDSFEMLSSMDIKMEPKPFSMGVRIEHLQSDVGRSQYGETFVKLPAADYKLNCRLPEGDSAYTFCMCPGGYVVAAASESGGVVTNGMSLSKRDGENANAALLVSLTPEDFPDRGVLSGMYWQRDIERRAFECAGGTYKAPAQTVGDFLAGISSTGDKGVRPSYKPGVCWGDIRQVLPEKICRAIATAIPELSKKLGCFADENAVMTAPETRSSSPVRILRGDSLESLSLKGLYPCGEGAGYAGGITSAAVDGMRCAEAVIAAINTK